MMNIKVLAVGKLKEKYWRDALAEYEKRLSGYCVFSVEEIKEAPGDDVVAEGKDILKKIRDDEYVIAMEIDGKQIDSREFADLIEGLGVRGKSRLTFVIGGSEGLSDQALARADERISFSSMTFPHQMFRVMLAEQIYRAFKIARGGKYHK